MLIVRPAHCNTLQKLTADFTKSPSVPGSVTTVIRSISLVVAVSVWTSTSTSSATQLFGDHKYCKLMIFATLISTFRDILQQRKIRNPTRSLKTANNNQSVYSHGGSAGAALLQCAVFPAAAAESGRWWQVAEVQAPPPQFVDPGQAQRQREAQAGLDIDGAVLRTLQHELEDQLCMSLSLPFITITVFLYR